MKSVVECSGILFEVTYTRDERNAITFKHASVLDASYRPVGPNLAEFLHTVLLFDSKLPFVAVRALSVIAEELNDLTSSSGDPL